MVPGWLDHPGVDGRIALEEGAPVGFALTCLTTLCREPGPLESRPESRPAFRAAAVDSPTAPPRPAEPGASLMGLDLLAIAVLPDHQRTGLGAWILGAVIEDAERRTRDTTLPLVEISLTVATANSPARALFEAHGFTRRPEPVSDYPSGLAALRMVRPLG